MAQAKHKVGLVVLATGGYIRFFRPFLESVRRYFFPGHTVRVLLFTDHDVADEEHGDFSLRVTAIKDEPWPYITLKRFEYIDAHQHLFDGLDHLFYCDVDARMVSEVADEILPDGARHQLSAVDHPSFACSGKPGLFFKALRGTSLTCRFGYRRIRGGFETDKKSTAFVGDDEGGVYFAGGFWGGITPAVLEMARQLRRNIERDLSRGHIARWHDESHLNRYLVDHPPKVLSPAYCRPEQIFRLPFKAKIVVLYKEEMSRFSKQTKRLEERAGRNARA
ncbi:MAG: hypothetical protein OXU44_00900 [Gammaproteobacteria bacterium]|nr:hypothetical protein [Gammaproteobacteria bacterium]MDD9807401.1 hypothetical protein [Gammaproteobacteria bacterium]